MRRVRSEDEQHYAAAGAKKRSMTGRASSGPLISGTSSSPTRSRLNVRNEQHDDSECATGDGPRPRE